MLDLLTFDNPIAWGHARLKGKLRTILWRSAAYGLLMVLLVLFSLRVEPGQNRAALNGWMVGLLALQVGILVLYGSNNVRNAIRKDFATGMIYSHRLMPLSGTEAVAGYIAGSVLQPLGLAAVTLLLGAAIAGPAGLSAVDWLVGNVLLLVFAISAWVLVASLSLLSPKAAGALIAVAIVLSVPGGMVFVALPALLAVCSIAVGPTLYGLVINGTGWNSVLHMSLLAQMAVTILAFIVGARKFSRHDVLATGPWMGLLIVAVYAIISVESIVHWSLIMPSFLAFPMDVATLQVIVSVLAGIVLAFVPMSAAAWLREDHHRRKQLGDAALGSKSVGVIIVSLIAAVLVWCIAWFCAPATTRETWPYWATAIGILAALLPVAAIMSWQYRTKPGAGAFVAGWIILMWVGPWAVGVGAYTMAMVNDEPERAAIADLQAVSGFSPVGTIVWSWTDDKARPGVGLGFQGVTAVAVPLLLLRRRKRPIHPDNIVVPVPNAGT